MATTTVKISGMHCGSCAMLIQMELEDLAGVTAVKIDSVRETGTVEHDETVTVEDVISAISCAGYEATVEA